MNFRKILSFITVCAIGGAGSISAHETTPEWLKSAVFYDIYPCSFMDSDGNGVGDIPGIISRLDYVKDLGADAIWMNPIYVSEWFDGGYDVTDYYKVDPRFGTNADVRRLVDEAHARGLKVCLDLVPGHTSRKNEWFVKSLTEGPEGRYADYYIFCNRISFKDSAALAERKALPDPESSKLGAWVPVGDAVDPEMVADPDRRYYLKNYYPCQPALNFGYGSPDPEKPWQQPTDAPGPKAVRRELKNIMAYWFDMGVDGFRIDMAASLVKNDKGKKETMKLWADMRRWIDTEYPGKVLISEWGVPTQSLPAGFDVDFALLHRNDWFSDLLRGAGNKQKSVADNAWFHREGKGCIKRFAEEYGKIYRKSRKYGYIAMFTSNHDVMRLNSEGRDTPQQCKVYMTFILSMPGVPFIHYGDEICMRNVKGLPSVEGSREERSGTRTPMQWDNTPSVGFSTAAPDSLFLPVFTDGGRLTVEAQKNDPESMLSHTKAMLQLRRQYPALANDGDWEIVSDAEQSYPLAYVRKGDSGEFLVLLNPAGRKVTVTLPVAAAEATELISTGKVDVKCKDNSLKVKMPGISSAIYKIIR